MNSCEIVSTVTAIACAIARCVPAKELPLLSAIFGELGSTLATITVHDDLCEKKSAPPETPPDTSIITAPTPTMIL